MYRLVVLTVIIVAFACNTLHAEWLVDGNAICTDYASQTGLCIVTDGFGGMILVWEDARSGYYSKDIYAQRVDRNGNVLWNSDCIPVCSYEGLQVRARAVSDSTDGAIIAWGDGRDSNFRPFVQRINSNGTPQWAIDGILASMNGSGYPDLTSAYGGSAIVAYRTDNYIYAQKIDENGEYVWFPPYYNGLRLTYNTMDKSYPSIVSDGAGGAIVSWHSSYFHPDFYRDEIDAQRVISTGNTSWGDAGITISGLRDNSGIPIMESLGEGSTAIAWENLRFTADNLMVNRISISGSSASGPQLLDDGVSFHYVDLASDGCGGFFIFWSVLQDGNYDLYCNLLGQDGLPRWADTKAICALPGDQIQPTSAYSDNGTAIVAWQDGRTGEYDIYVQKVDSSGTLLWGTDGLSTCTATGDQKIPCLLAAFDGGALIGWIDERYGNADIFATYIKNPLLHEPELEPIEPQDIDIGDTLFIQLDASDSDPEDVLTFSTNADDVLPGVVSFDTVSGLFEWIPQTGDAGDYVVTFSVSDGIYDDSEEVLVSVFQDGNRPPVLEPVEDVIVFETYLAEIIVYATDPDGDDLSYSIDDTRFEQTANRFFWQTEEGDSGSFDVVLTVSDGMFDRSDTAKVHIWPTDFNHDPMIDNSNLVFQWVTHNGAWHTEDDGFFSGTELWNDAIVSGSLFQTYDSLSITARIYRGSTNHMIGFTDTGPEETDFFYGNINHGVCIHITGTIRPTWDVNNTEYWDMTLAEGYYDVYVELDAFENLVNFAIDDVPSVDSPLSTFNEPLWTASVPRSIESGYFIQINPYGPASKVFDIWKICIDVPVLSVYLQSYAANPESGHILVEWSLNGESDDISFEVAKSENGGDYYPYSVHIEGDGFNYFFADRQIEPGVRYSYRVIAIEDDERVFLFDTEGVEPRPVPLVLLQNRPNPFNPSTVIGFQLPNDGRVVIEIFDVAGRCVVHLLNEVRPAGPNQITWNGLGTNGDPVESGVYFYRLSFGKDKICKKMVMLR